MGSYVEKIEGKGFVIVVSEVVDETCIDITLSECEREFLSKIVNQRRRLEWLTSRSVVRWELGDNQTTSYDEIGAPTLVSNEKHISISHTQNLVCVMIADKKCGIDIENSNRDFNRVASRFLSLNERNLINESHYSLAWCVKEAAFKLFGDKNIDFASMITIEDIDECNSAVLVRYAGAQYTFKYLKFKDNYIVYSV